MEQLAQRIVLLSGWRRLTLAAGLGAVSALAQAPFHAFAILLVTLPPLVWLLDGAVATTPGNRARVLWAIFGIGWWFGLGYFVAGLWWIANALLVEAPEFAWAIPLAVLGLPALLAVFHGAACALAGLIWSNGIGRLFALAAAFGLAEWARGVVLTGFPWNALGYALAPVPVMMQSAALAGVAAMSAAAVLVFALPAQFAAGPRAGLVGLAVSALLLGGHVGFGVWRLAEQPRADLTGTIVRLVQPAIPQGVKVGGDDDAAVFRTLLDLTALEPQDNAGRPPDIVIWPETAVPFVLTRDPGALTAIGATLGDGQTLLTGAIREERLEDGPARFYNAVLAITAQGVISAAADKVHLVPFGEYLPFAGRLEAWGLQAVAAADRGYSAAAARVPIAVGDAVFWPLICYESIFAGHAHPRAGDGVTAIVNVTNDAWFGRTPGPWQHMHQTRLRAVETGLPLVRVANNGISAMIDPLGRVTARIAHDARAVADVALPAPMQPLFDRSNKSRNFWLFIGALFAIAILARVRWLPLFMKSNQ